MISVNSDATLILFFAVMAFAVTAVFGLYKSNSDLSKSRLTRAVRPGVGQVKSASDLPSIARARYSFLKKRKRKEGSNAILGALNSIEELLCSSGLKWRLSSFFVVVLLLFLGIASSLIIVAKADTLVSLIFAAPTALFFAIHFLVRDRKSVV